MANRITMACIAACALAVPLAAPPASAEGSIATTIALPDGFRPEGIAVGHGRTIYAGSIGTGAIYAADLVTGEGSVLVPAQPGRAAIGLSFDPRTNLIYVAGGPTGAAYVYDARTGATVAAVQLTREASTFINDQVVVGDAVYFTESRRPVLYRLPLSRAARPVPEAVTEVPLGGEFVQVAGALNANGIEATADGRSLIVVNTALGALYRVDAATGDARLIDLGGATMTNGDGLHLRGETLFVVQNRLNQIAVLDLEPGLARGALREVLSDTRFDVPTTIASHGALYVVNARFGTPPTPTTTYTIEKVVRPD